MDVLIATDWRRRVAIATARLSLCLLLVAAPFRSADAAPQGTMENDIKAAFLYNFSKFIEWPAARDPHADETFRICVIADAEFTRAVDRIIEGELVEGRRLTRVEPQSPEDARACNILYVGRGEHDRGVRLLAGVRQSPVLTVSDAPRFVKQGGAIEFVLENNRVRFDVSTRATDRAGLKVSSKLLRVAREVEGREP